MYKVVLAAIWLGVNLRTFFHILVNKPRRFGLEKGVASMQEIIFNLRAFLGQRHEDIVALLDNIQSDSVLLGRFRRALYLTAFGLFLEMVVYAVITAGFEAWGALIFGGLVVASNLQAIILLIIMAILVQNRQWFILSFRKIQIMIVPALILELAWLVYLIGHWSGLNGLLVQQFLL